MTTTFDPSQYPDEDTLLTPAEIIKREQIKRAPTSPYAMYNNADRLLSMYTRLQAEGGFERNWAKYGGIAKAEREITQRLNRSTTWVETVDLLDKALSIKTRRVSPRQIVPHLYDNENFEYDLRTTVMAQFYWTVTAYRSIAYSVYDSNFGSTVHEKNVAWKIGVARAGFSTLLESTLLVANAWRYDRDLMSPANRPTSLNYSGGNLEEEQLNWDNRLKSVKTARGKTGAAVAAGFTFNAILGVTQFAFSLKAAEDAKDDRGIATAAIGIASQVVNTVYNAMRSLHQYLNATNQWTSGARTNLGLISNVTGVVQAGLSIAGIVPALTDPEVQKDPEKVAVLTIEMGVQILAGVTQVLANAALVRAVGLGLTGLKLAGPAIGAAASALALAISPLEIYGLVKQSEYADKLGEIGAEMSRHGYEGDSYLSSLYHDKTNYEAGFLAASTALALIGTVASVALLATGVGAPVAAVIGLVVGVVSGILQMEKTLWLEQIAADYTNKIIAAGGPVAFFEKSLSAHYDQLITSSDTVQMLKDLQSDYGVDSVIGVTTVTTDSTTRELAAITQTAAYLKQAETFIGRFEDGQVVEDQQIKVDLTTGSMHLSGIAGQSQLLAFLTPLVASGSTDPVRIYKGEDNTKKTYYTELHTIGSGNWSIVDGPADTVMRLTDVTTLITDVKGNVQADVKIDVSGGDGNDTVIPGAGRVDFDGGSGTDTVSYRALDGDSTIYVHPDANDDNTLIVQKDMWHVNVFQDQTNTQNYDFGKNKETVEYRDVKLVNVLHMTMEDRLTNVEVIAGSKGNDEMHGNAQNNNFSGGEGDDKIYGGAGDDILTGGPGSDYLEGGDGNDYFIQGIARNERDIVRGGNGIDTLDYSQNKFPETGTINGVDKTGIQVDMVKGIVYKYPGMDHTILDTFPSIDYFLGIENVIGTSLDGTIQGDGSDNVLIGGLGNDAISGGAATTG